MRRDDLRKADRERVTLIFAGLTAFGALLVNEIWRRLSDLNHAHEKAVEVQHTYVSQERHESDIKAVEQKVETLRDDSLGHQGRAQGVASVGRIVVAAVTVLGAVLTLVVLIANHAFG
jgi:hypothetical protein